MGRTVRWISFRGEDAGLCRFGALKPREDLRNFRAERDSDCSAAQEKDGKGCNEKTAEAGIVGRREKESGSFYADSDSGSSGTKGSE